MSNTKTLFCNSFRPKRTLNSKKYGVANIRYTHTTTTVIHTSTKLDRECFS